ncbi:hypothetical protein [Candidatus Magnetomonas plexicatena]|uniref:hypothetical protein n=1 Tax=Candidatus Magnetomonas plexicatena TaxID=2552947 RepID=UPI001C799C09|nr:hypothetical protein E2O03_009995 [Nitrospirales bacterium LBB_01]
MTSKKENILNTCSLLVFAVVIFLRAPILLIAPRFYDEEGLSYFKYAYENPFFKSLFVVQPDRGYFEIFTNTAMAFASIAPLRYAPTVCALMAFLAQLIPFAIVLWGRSFFFDTYLKKIVVALIIIFVQSTGQIWITARHTQFFLLLTTFLILIADVQGEAKFRVWAYRLLLLIGGFAGLTSCYLTPVYILRALQKKSREFTIHAAILVFSSLCQIAIVAHSYYTIGLPQRFNNSNFISIFLLYLTENYLIPIFGYTFTQIMLSNLIFLIFVVPVAIYLIWVMYKSILDINRQVLALGIIFCSITLILTSLDMTGAARYTYAPGVMLMVLILSYVKFDKNSFLKISSLAAFVLTLIALTTSMMEYRARMKVYANTSWPDWKAEISIWEKDPNYPIRIWPQFDDYKPVLKLSQSKDK